MRQILVVNTYTPNNILLKRWVTFIIAKCCIMIKNKTILVKGTEIAIYQGNLTDYISLTDIARYKNTGGYTDDIIRNWLRNRNTIELLGFWEQMHNTDFKPIEFDTFRSQAGLNSFTMTPKKWIESTNPIGIISKPGRYGGTYAHKDIAFEFASWISIEFKLYIIKEFQRLKEDENSRSTLNWNLQRTLAKLNYHIHTDAIKEKLIPQELRRAQINFVYASEADLLNVALFGMTAKEWRDRNLETEGNIRDAATIEQLVVLSNLESLNAVLIHQGMAQPKRLQQLNTIAITQMKSLVKNRLTKKLISPLPANP
jgi:phage regulator Rha-like protein